MEESSAEEVTQRRAVYYTYIPCHLLQETIRAILKCLGLESNSDNSSSSEEMDPKAKETSSSNTGQSLSTDPPSTSETDTYTLEDAARPVRRPPRPVISSGQPPQINSSSS